MDSHKSIFNDPSFKTGFSLPSQREEVYMPPLHIRLRFSQLDSDDSDLGETCIELSETLKDRSVSPSTVCDEGAASLVGTQVTGQVALFADAWIRLDLIQSILDGPCEPGLPPAAQVILKTRIRKQSLERYRMKKKRRVCGRRVQYEGRQLLATKRRRVQGRFIPVKSTTAV